MHGMITDTFLDEKKNVLRNVHVSNSSRVWLCNTTRKHKQFTTDLLRVLARVAIFHFQLLSLVPVALPQTFTRIPALFSRMLITTALLAAFDSLAALSGVDYLAD